ncbi:MAG: hypothetical protein QM594_09310 [Niabella sp.]
MKNLILSAAVMLSLTFSASAASKEPVSEKAQKTFYTIFKDADNVSWSNTGRQYNAFFVADNIKTRAMFDAKGNLVQTIRYYSEEELPENVLYSVKKTYKGKEVFGVTEVANQYGVHYRIVLRDEKTYTHINANNMGETEVVSKYKRADK